MTASVSRSCGSSRRDSTQATCGSRTTASAASISRSRCSTTRPRRSSSTPCRVAEQPGTVYVLEPDLDADGVEASQPDHAEGSFQGHAMTPDSVFALVRTLGGRAAQRDDRRLRAADLRSGERGEHGAQRTGRQCGSGSGRRSSSNCSRGWCRLRVRPDARARPCGRHHDRRHRHGRWAARCCASSCASARTSASFPTASSSAFSCSPRTPSARAPSLQCVVEPGSERSRRRGGARRRSTRRSFAVPVHRWSSARTTILTPATTASARRRSHQHTRKEERRCRSCSVVRRAVCARLRSG